MPEPPRRKRFQLHLSTAIVMMFVAGGIIWANVNKNDVTHADITLGIPILFGKTCGWPNVAYWTMGNITEIPPKFFYRGIAINISVALIILFATWFLCEWLIRRRALRKGA